MALINNHKLWWILLLLATIAVSVLTAYEVTFSGMLLSIAGHFLFAFVVAVIPWLAFKLLGKPLSTAQIMYSITLGWLILAVSNVLVIPG